MNYYKITAALIAAVTAFSLTSCGAAVREEIAGGEVTEPSAEAEDVTEADREDSISDFINSIKDEIDSLDEERSGDTYENESESDYDDGGLSGDRVMDIELKKRSMTADNDGFKIDGTVLYDYDGISPEVHIPEGITRIESMAFHSNTIVEALYIPGSVEEIGESAFWSCSALKFVSAEEGLKKIGDTAFWSCSSMEDVNLPESLEDIGSTAFWAISELTVHSPAGSAAEKFAKVSGFDWSDTYAEYAMSDRKNIIRASQYAGSDFTEFNIPDNITGIEAEAFQYCDQLESITIPSNVEYIGSNAFEYCDELRTVVINGCREIKAEAFEYCESLTTAYICEGCERIGSSAFAYCRELKDIWLPASANDIDKRAFEYCSPELTLHVPSGSYAEDYAISMNIPFDNNSGEIIHG